MTFDALLAAALDLQLAQRAELVAQLAASLAPESQPSSAAHRPSGTERARRSTALRTLTGAASQQSDAKS